MADRNAIADLFATYAWGNDVRDVDLIGSLFAAEGKFTLSIAGEQAIEPLPSREAIKAFFGEALGAQTDQRRHVTSNLRFVEESDDSARVVAYLSLLITDEGQVRLQCTGVYDTEVRREGDGWTFAAMDLALDSGF